jgi:cell division protein FtsQ
MPRIGTTKDRIRNARSRRSGAAARVRLWLKRFGLVSAGTIAVVWVGAWLVLSGALYDGARYVRNGFDRTAAAHGYAVENILIEGRVNMDRAALKDLIGVQKGDPIFAFDPSDAQDVLSRTGWVKKARVERRLPDTIYVGLTERKPLALWQQKGKLRLIDDDGVTITDENLGTFADLMILVGEDVPDEARTFLDWVYGEPEIANRAESAVRVGGRRWDLYLRSPSGKIVVKLPEGDAAPSFRRLAAAQAREGLMDKAISEIDLREPDRITVRTRDVGESAMQKIKASY